jgi:peptide deformylase
MWEGEGDQEMMLVQASNDPDKLLTTPTERVEDFSEVPAIELKLRTAIRLNVDKDGDPALVGLAANQIGIPKAVTIVLIGHETGEYEWLTMVNPKITMASDATDTDIEGCGSLREPEELYYDVSRPVRVMVSYQNRFGEEEGIGLIEFSARVAQHEIDHLNGIMISDRGILVEKERG